MSPERYKVVARTIGTVMVCLAVALAGISSSPPDASAAVERHLLVLHSYHRGYKWADDITRGIEAAVRGEGTTLKVHYEYMDTKRESDPEYFRLLFEAYRYKFRNSGFDVIIASDNDAFDFLKRYRDDLFPGTPVVFCGVNYFEPSQLEGKRLLTGINEAADIKATLDLALRFHPDTRQVVVVNDTTTTGRVIHKEIDKLIPHYRGRVQFSFLEEVEMPAIQAEVQKLGPGSLVLFSLFSRDREGRFMEYYEGISQVAEVCRVPIYGVWDFYLGYGIVGGMLTSGYYQGNTAGMIAVRILHGERIENIPVIMESPNRFMFDYRQLRRFHLDPSAMPPGSIVINSPSSLYTVSRQLFLGIIAALAGSTLIIVFLLYNTARRRQAEQRALRLAAIVESSDDAIIGKTPDGTITSWNRGAEKIFGYSEREMIGKPLITLVPAEYRDELFRVHERIRQGEHFEHFETVRTRKDGERICMSLTFSPVKDAQGRVVAVSTVGRDITERKRTERVLLENARINRELEIAKDIQKSFLAPCPANLPGLLMSCCCVPASQVGGDYYDFFSLEGGLVDVVIADVAGHSVGSALLMTETRSVIHAKVNAGRSPGKLLAAVNELLHEDLSRAELQISMFYARLNTENHTVAYANAGHIRPLLYRSREGELMELDADGLLMGIHQDVHFEEIVAGVESGDILLLYTDGVTEAENVEEEQFGIARLSRIIAEQCESHPREIIAEVLLELAAFSGAMTRNDDVTMIAIKVM